MSRFPIFQRWWRVGVLAIVVLTLPVLTVCYLNHRMKTLVAEINSTGAGATVETQTPWLVPVLSRVGISVDQPMFLWKITAVDFRDEQPVTPEKMRRVVLTANRLGGVREVEMWTPDGRLDAASLEPLQGLEDLESLDLQCGLHDDVLEVVSGIHQLRELQLQQPYNTDLTDTGFGALAKLPRLEKLKILGGGLTSDDAAALAQIRSLRLLALKSCSVDAEGLRHLASLPHLERLSLLDSMPQIRGADGSLEHDVISFERDVIPTLAAMPALRRLRIGETDGLAPDQVAKLNAALPSVTVIECDMANQAKTLLW